MSGMTITADDVVKIMKAAKCSRLTYLKYDTLEMKFDTGEHPDKTKNIASHMDVMSAGEVSLPLDSQLPELDDIVEDEKLLLAELADQLAIEDPDKFEQLQLKLMNSKGED